MQINVATVTTQQFIRSLTGLKVILTKAAAYADAKKIDMAVLFKSRLVPDQYPLDKQIQIACDTAKFCVSRLTDHKAPAYEDNEASFEQFIQRIDNTIAFLNSAKAEDFASFNQRTASFVWNPGYKLSGEAYLQQFVIPNFYFHLTTAYAILRHAGVDIGKADYLGQMDWQSA